LERESANLSNNFVLWKNNKRQQQNNNQQQKKQRKTKEKKKNKNFFCFVLVDPDHTTTVVHSPPCHTKIKTTKHTVKNMTHTRMNKIFEQVHIALHKNK